MNKLLSADFDDELGKDLFVQTNLISKKIENLELETLLSGKYDGNNAILSLHPRSSVELNHKIGFRCYIECT